MIRILFICHGNICRSSAAEYILKDIVERAGCSSAFHIESKGTSAEELGNGMYPPMAEVLKSRGIDFLGHRARCLHREDYDKFDFLIGMDDENLYNMKRLYKDRGSSKLYMLLDFTDKPGEISDPWYTRDFNKAFEDISKGCAALFEYLKKEKGL